MNDRIEKLGRSVIQHGVHSNRIYLMSYNEQNCEKLLADLEKIASDHGYDKIILKLPGRACDSFFRAGFQEEARIIGFFPDGETCHFLSRFLSEERRRNPQQDKHREIIHAAMVHRPKKLKSLEGSLRLEMLNERYADAASSLYARVFASYPFPITDPEYIRTTMRSHVDYYGVLHGEELVALASTEKDKTLKNAEMTDFAINPDWRGRHLARHLLVAMEKSIQEQGYKTLYTIARAVSIPMNYTFAGTGYSFGGALVNNTQISGSIESMNIWAKHL